MNLEWRDEAQTILAKIDGNHTVIIEAGHDEWAELSARDDILPFTDFTPQTDEIRPKRNALLVACDWTQLPDAPVDQTAWAAYRQALRDVTDQEGFPANVIWPVPPT